MADVAPAEAHLIECPDFEMKPLRPIAKPIKQKQQQKKTIIYFENRRALMTHICTTKCVLRVIYIAKATACIIYFLFNTLQNPEYILHVRHMVSFSRFANVNTI